MIWKIFSKTFVPTKHEKIGKHFPENIFLHTKHTLNDFYCAPRGNTLMISLLPSLRNAYALLMQEEKQREVQNTPKFHGESSSFIVDNAQRSLSTNFRGQKGNYDNKKSNLVRRYCNKT